MLGTQPPKIIINKMRIWQYLSKEEYIKCLIPPQKQRLNHYRIITIWIQGEGLEPLMAAN